MKDCTLVLPHQLFQHHPALAKNQPVLLVEEPLFFSELQFHCKKLILHRATMQWYAQWLTDAGYKVHYLGYDDAAADLRNIDKWLTKNGFAEVHVAELCDDWLHRRLHRACKAANIGINSYRTPMFLNAPEEGAFFDKRKKYFQTDFYIHQRKTHGWLMDSGGQPMGGKFSFDDENRKPYPKKQKPPLTLPVKPNVYVHDARVWVEKHFKDAYGDAKSLFGKEGFYPTNFVEAEAWLERFLHERFADFGVYEDALVAAEAVLHHAVLTPMLNIGLLTPQQVLNAALHQGLHKMIPLNSLEGFIRQIVGWREFIRMVYHREGRKQRTRNYWGFSRRIPASFWEGNTGIVPVDITIQKVLANAYNHHIERLMIMGNFMLLCEFDPHEVYKWFMEMYIDAYDWVMVPNVYGMTQFADGGLMTTKPYISGSNYLMKMGDFPKGEWQKTWDGLFWRFMHVHRDFFGQNPRLGMLLSSWDKMGESKQAAHLKAAEDFLAKLDAANEAEA